MPWGTIELEEEVEAWLLALPDELFGQAERYIDLLATEGVHLGEPFTRQLRGKLRELRFHLGRQQTRITYYIATGRRIVLLTVFAKTRQRERLEIQRAWRSMQTCITEGHTAEDDE
ncbi:MAG TPA: type II toxin-antitoxin system RelE/ParE family toxin [Acidimicrobiales bacterium]|nr:type II toxin-antitoxin system RelE/ParE family toxin [Acidimicrobiales bacterium]